MEIILAIAFPALKSSFASRLRWAPMKNGWIIMQTKTKKEEGTAE